MDKDKMKKSFLNRIESIESRRINRQVNEPITFFDEECGMTMQVIGNGLVVPLPIDDEKE